MEAAALADELLTRYPGRLYSRTDSSAHKIVPTYRFEHPTSWPAPGYEARARGRRLSGDVRGAAADLQQAIAYLMPRRLAGPWAYAGTVGLWELRRLRTLSEDRARLLRVQLGRHAAYCAERHRRWQLDDPSDSQSQEPTPHPSVSVTDTVCRLSEIAFGGRFAVSKADVAALRRAATDSVARLLVALADSTPSRLRAALRTATAVVEGRIGGFVRAPCAATQVGPYGMAWHDADSYGLRARIRQALGDYAGARTDLDTALMLQPLYGRYCYARGLLRLDHLNDPVGGCADLRRSYVLEFGPQPTTAPFWRGCPLGPSERADVAAYQQRMIDSIRVLEAYVAAGRFGRALPLATALRRTGVGPPPVGRRVSDVLRNPDLVALQCGVALALAGSGQPQRGLRALDSLLQRLDGQPVAAPLHCTRAQILADYLHDKAGARAALVRCAELRPPSAVPPPILLTGVGLTAGGVRRRLAARSLGKQVNRTRHNVADWLLDDHRLQVGVFGLVGSAGRGASGGAFAGVHKEGKWDVSLVFHSPGAGLELLARPLVLAPKVWYEAEFLFVGGRVDLTYYRSHHLDDLRLTPQVGLSLMGYGNLFYGYNIALTPDRLDMLNRHRLTLFLNSLPSMW